MELKGSRTERNLMAPLCRRRLILTGEGFGYIVKLQVRVFSTISQTRIIILVCVTYTLYIH